jgi:hypothetical protein
VEWSLDSSLPNLCPVIPTFNQDGHIKLSLAVVAISIGGLKCRIQFWKGTTQGSSQQSLVEIGSVVSVENIFFNMGNSHKNLLVWNQ